MAAEAEAEAETPAMEEPAVFFDGLSAKKRFVALQFGEALAIVEDGAALALWPYDEIRRVEGPNGFVLRREGAETGLARLELRDARHREAIAAHCRLLEGKGARGGTRAIVLWSLAATASVVGLVWFGIPILADRVAPLVPAAFERRVGEAAEAQLRLIFPHKACNSEGGSAALAALSERLQARAGLQTPATIEIVDSVIPNAFALPGGKVYFFSGLLNKSESPDEVAGVLAHELGHLAHRDAMRKLIAMGGTSYLVGLLFGDVTGAGALLFASRALLGASYSREAEAQADRFAAELLGKLGRPARPLGELLVRISRREETPALGLLHDHPLSADRLAALRAADSGETGPELLSAGEWLELRAICRETKIRREGETSSGSD